jgi:uncharacterized protein YdeI (BOF family)
MKFPTRTTLAATAAMLFATAALAATSTTSSISNMPNGGMVSLTGTVENFDNAHSFVLRDSTGTMKVDLSGAKSVVLKNGDTVDVTGKIDKGLLGTQVAATSVNEDKGVGQQIGDAIDSMTGQTPASNAQAFNVKSLPSNGLVKVSGMVDSVSSEKKFTLKDSTGDVTVNLAAGQSASLNKGAAVSVVGYVDSGMLGKSINATEVDVQSNGVPATKQ